MEQKEEPIYRTIQIQATEVEKRAKTTEKEQFFNKWCWNKFRRSLYKSVNLNTNFTSFTKINSTQITDIKYKMQNYTTGRRKTKMAA